MGFALSSVLRNKITLKDGVVEQQNFSDYVVPRMNEMPQIDVHIVPSQDAPTGMGEPGLPPLAPAEALEVSMVQSVAGTLPGGTLTRARPFRAPHHSASMAALRMRKVRNAVFFMVVCPYGGYFTPKRSGFWAMA